mmetsp:Transcript_91915/g.163640  ORF Transcript_91915/g.163640 Transcript_91915/m.163640 type:complete len:141 (+) Transcript_91915:120-542(+)
MDTHSSFWNACSPCLGHGLARASAESSASSTPPRKTLIEQQGKPLAERHGLVKPWHHRGFEALRRSKPLEQATLKFPSRLKISVFYLDEIPDASACCSGKMVVKPDSSACCPGKMAVKAELAASQDSPACTNSPSISSRS